MKIDRNVVLQMIQWNRFRIRAAKDPQYKFGLGKENSLVRFVKEGEIEKELPFCGPDLLMFFDRDDWELVPNQD